MNFDSIEACLAYIEQCLGMGLENAGEEIKRIMEEQLNKEIYQNHSPTMYDRTGQLGESISVTEQTNKSVNVEYQDNGDWNSVKTGEHFFPLEGFRSGSVWAPNGGRYQADPLKEAFEISKQEIPEILKRYLQGLGIPIE